MKSFSDIETTEAPAVDVGTSHSLNGYHPLPGDDIKINITSVADLISQNVGQNSNAGQAANAIQPKNAAQNPTLGTKFKMFTHFIFLNMWDAFTPLFTLVFYSWLIHDIIWFVNNEDERYGANPSDLMVGFFWKNLINMFTTSNFMQFNDWPNENLWLSNFCPDTLNSFCSDKPSERLAYLSDLIFVATITTAIGALLAVKRRHFLKPMTFGRFNQIQNTIQATNINSLQWITPFATKNEMLKELSFALQWSLYNNADITAELTYLKNNSRLTSYIARRALSEWKTLKTFAMMLLLGTANFYPLARYLESVAFKTARIAVYQNNLNNCITQGNVYTYNNLLENYQCTPCSDWENLGLSPLDMQNFEKCYNALFAEQRTPDVINEHFSKIIQYKNLINLPNLDLSKQNLANWNVNDLQTLFTTAMKFSNQWNILNFSQEQTDQAFVEQQLKLLIDFLEANIFNQLVARSLGLPPIQDARFIESFSGSNATVIDLTETALSAEAQNQLSITTKNLLNLQTLILRNTGLTSLSLPTRAEKKMRVDISKNPIVATVIANLCPQNGTSIVSDLDVSYIPIDDAFAEALGYCDLDRLTMDNTMTDYTPGDTLSSSLQANANLQHLSLARNNLNGFGYAIFPPLNAKKMFSLDVTDAQLDEQDMVYLNQFANVSYSMRDYIIGNNRYDNVAWNGFTDAISDKHINTLSTPSNNLGNTGVSNLINSISHGNGTIHSLDLSNNNLLQEDVVPLKDLQPKTNKIILSDNRFDDSTCADLSQSFQEIDFSNTHADGQCLVKYFSKDSYRDNKSFHLEKTALTSADALAFINHLISSDYPLSFIGNDELTRTQKRALSKAITNYQTGDIYLSEDKLPATVIRMLCRAFIYANIPLDKLHLSYNKSTRNLCLSNQGNTQDTNVSTGTQPTLTTTKYAPSLATKRTLLSKFSFLKHSQNKQNIETQEKNYHANTNS